MSRAALRWATSALVVTTFFSASGMHGAVAAEGHNAPVRFGAELACVREGGADVSFTIANIGRRRLKIKGDFHLLLETVGPRGHRVASLVFVFPAPPFQVIEAGEQETFLVPMGVGEEGEQGVDLSAHRLLLRSEVFFTQRPGHGMERGFSYPGCPPPKS
jgi:hypothetical protein